MFVLFSLHVRNTVGFLYSIMNKFLEKRGGMNAPAELAHYIAQMLPFSVKMYRP